MNASMDIQQAIARLSLDERESIAAWLHLHTFDDGNTESRVAEPFPPAYGVKVQPPYVSVEDYLKFEERSSIRHEYVAGRMFAMSGVTLRHNVISMNISHAFMTHLRGGPCRAFMAEVRAHIKVSQDDVFYYPDILVTYGALDLTERNVRNPKLVIEVLSPSTQTLDRREKALNYRQIATLEEYGLVAQSQPEVTIQRRAENWAPRVFEGLEAVAEFRSIDLALPLTRIYGEVPM